MLRGVDSGEHRKAVKAATTESSVNSFEVVAREWAGRQASVWVGSTCKRTLRRFELDVFPWIGARALASVTGSCQRSFRLEGVSQAAAWVGSVSLRC